MFFYLSNSGLKYNCIAAAFRFSLPYNSTNSFSLLTNVAEHGFRKATTAPTPPVSEQTSPLSDETSSVADLKI